MTAKWRSVGCAATALLFSTAGILHFVAPSPYLKVMPPFIPFPLAMVYISGFFEVAGGVGLMIPRFRKAAALGLIALLVAVFPVNIYMFSRQLSLEGWTFYTAMLALRLPLQPLLAFWIHRLGAHFDRDGGPPRP